MNETPFFTHSKIAGTSYRQEIIPTLKKEQKLKLIREPDNIHDTNAVRIETNQEEIIGYVKSKNGLNQDVATLIDRGKELQCRITEITGGPDKGELYYGVNIAIYESTEDKQKTEENKMGDATKFAEGDFIDGDFVKKNQGVIITILSVTPTKTHFGEKLQAEVSAKLPSGQLRQKKWNLNRPTVRNCIDNFGKDYDTWSGQILRPTVERGENGKEMVIGHATITPTTPTPTEGVGAPSGGN